MIRMENNRGCGRGEKRVGYSYIVPDLTLYPTMKLMKIFLIHPFLDENHKYLYNILIKKKHFFKLIYYSKNPHLRENIILFYSRRPLQQGSYRPTAKFDDQ